MILITKSSANPVVLTLNEKTTLASPTFLFRFVNDTSKKEKAFIAADTSSFKYRYNQFTITEDATEDTLNGTVSLSEGFWNYYVYEQSSTTNLDYTQASTLLERGKVKVTQSQAADSVYNQQAQTWNVYE